MGGLRAVWGAAVRGRNSGRVGAISWEEVIAATLGHRISIDGGEAIRPPKPSGGAGARPEVSGWPWPTSAVSGDMLIRLTPPGSVRGAGSRPGAMERASCAG